MQTIRTWWLFVLRPILLHHRERFYMGIAWRIPKPICYWVFVRMCANTTGNPGERLTRDVLTQHAR